MALTRVGDLVGGGDSSLAGDLTKDLIGGDSSLAGDLAEGCNAFRV
jgi:hypothetical protein